MAAYMHGNLAIDEQYQSPSERKVRITTKKVIRKHSIPAREKLLYLFVISICVVIAGMVIFQYAQAYEINTKIQQLESEITKIEMENRNLQLTARKLQEPKRFFELSEALGFTAATERKVSQVASQSMPLTEEETTVALEDNSIAYIE